MFISKASLTVERTSVLYGSSLSLLVNMLSLALADIAYMQQHIQDTLVHPILAVNISCMLIAFVAIWLRIITRRMIRAPLKVDDWTIIGATAGLSVHRNNSGGG